MSSDKGDALGRIAELAQQLAVAGETGCGALRRAYLDAVGHYLADQSGDDRLAFPLFDVIEMLERDERPERRESASPPSDKLLAQICAVVDILVSAGYSLDHACQVVTRQMIARNVRVLSGGDARAWRNLQAWRHKLIALKPEPAWKVYQGFKAELVADHGAQVAEAAARDAVWDRRSASGKTAA